MNDWKMSCIQYGTQKRKALWTRSLHSRRDPPQQHSISSFIRQLNFFLLLLFRCVIRLSKSLSKICIQWLARFDARVAFIECRRREREAENPNRQFHSFLRRRQLFACCLTPVWKSRSLAHTRNCSILRCAEEIVSISLWIGAHSSTLQSNDE